MAKPKRQSSGRDQREQGSILLMLSLIIFVFMSASVALASAQLMHAKAAHAQYNKFLANMAAEAGVYAAFDATLSITPRVALDSGNGRLVQYEAQISGATQPFSIQSTGSVTVDGFTYLSVVTATVSNGVIAQWSYGP